MKKIVTAIMFSLLLAVGITSSASAEETAPEQNDQTAGTMAVPAPDPGSSYMYMGKQEGHSWTHKISSSSFAIAFGSSEKLISQVFGIGGSVWSWINSGYEPTSYAKIYSKVEEHNAFSASLKTKYLWFEDSQFNTYQETTERIEKASCSQYNAYCWKD
ncbi:hypothetical protein [Halobacillus sp. A5]|uniref:hypothetical protein n=1 Tax=Halobacillus sp. A5 TaxID=2880263 RepID=UPI0020A6A2CD|nr:hypothetical protein [Halobacillus sp. A5]MCP3026627.1 hypothetical protein [Halobacillus sp. A5]